MVQNGPAMVDGNGPHFYLLCSWRKTSEPKDLDSVLCYCFSNPVVIGGQVCGGNGKLR